MRINADFHIHSYLSRATSKSLNLENAYKWAQLKGIQLLGTGDFTHPEWLAQIKEKLEPAEEGLFRLKEEYAKAMQKEVFPAVQGPVRFIITGEISSIYKKAGQVRKIHNLVFVPDIETAAGIQKTLGRIGNITSDGRPILGLDARNLLEIVLEAHPLAFLIPAHIWTPWFSLLGSKSGFDSIQECFDDLSEHVFALETGLSSDPPMNWRLSQLDRFTLVSNSDAHSLEKIGREATLFDTEFSYQAILEAMRTRNPKSFLGTVEFFPEEGKYHYDGHRKCQVRLDPQVTSSNKGLCPVCGNPVTVGVMHRVEILADRPQGGRPKNAPPYYNLIPLPELLAEIKEVGPNSKKVREIYQSLLSRLGSEMEILVAVSLEEIARQETDMLAEAIRRMRKGQIHPLAGYDGEFGLIRVFQEGEKEQFSSQLSLLESPIKKRKSPLPEVAPRAEVAPQAEVAARAEVIEIIFPPSPIQKRGSTSGRGIPSGRGSPSVTGSSCPQQAQDIFPVPPKGLEASTSEGVSSSGLPSQLSQEQLQAVFHQHGPLLILAGPGTGKTRTLTYRIAHLINQGAAAPQHVLAVTFTNKAVAEMEGRLLNLLGQEVSWQITIKTFHGLALAILHQEAHHLDLPEGFTILDEPEKLTLLREITKDRAVREIAENISLSKARLLYPEDYADIPGKEPFFPDERFVETYTLYQDRLKQSAMLDYDDLIGFVVKLFQAQPQIVEKYRNRFLWISVDEYQDINLAQYTFLRLLSPGEANLCVIGDQDQAIYGFRGADSQIFLNFRNDYPRARIVELSRNYRSTEPILNASAQIITKNPDRKEVKLWSGIVSEKKVNIHQSPTDRAEAEFVVHQVERLMGGTSHFALDSGRVDSGDEQLCQSFADIAVLYRLGGQSRVLIDAFERAGIPYQTVGETPLMHRPEIRGVLSQLRLYQTPVQEEIKELIRAIIHKNHLKKTYPDAQESWEKLMELAGAFGNKLTEFLEYTVLAKETDFYSWRIERVMLMTIHASKGLEFPVVFITGCEDSLLPYTLASHDIEEERRLLYVGMTRAQKILFLTYAKTRFLYGQRYNNPPSRFLADIEDSLKAAQKAWLPGKRKIPEQTAQLELFPELIWLSSD